MNTLKEIASVLKSSKRVTIFTHMRLDGDTLGCALALSRALDYLGVKNEIVNEEKISPKYTFMAGTDKIVLTPSFEADTLVCVDISSVARMGALQTYFNAHARKAVTVNIDHHISNASFCKYNFVRERSSNCENVAELIGEMSVPMDGFIADALFLGLLTDSGGFAHADVDGGTFRTAGLCADAGAHVKDITYEMYKKQSKSRAKFYLSVLSKLRFELDDKLAIVVIPRSEMEKYSVDFAETEGIVDFGLTVDTVEVSVCLLEMKSRQYKVSLRSKGKANVNEMARAYGGGGHILASGCMLFGELEEIVDKLSYSTRQQLDL